MENPNARIAQLAEYLFNGTSLCDRHIRPAIREQQEERERIEP
jgi:hypothetical protein